MNIQKIMEANKLYILILISIAIANIFIHIWVWSVFQNKKTKSSEDKIETYRKYLIFNKKCKVPDYEFYGGNTSFYEKKEYVPCTKMKLLTKITKIENKFYIVVNTSGRQNASIECCYCNVTNDTSDEPDFQIDVSACTFFEDKIQLTNDVVYVKCYYDNYLVYENVHTVITFNESIYRKNADNSNLVKRPNILILGISSVARKDFGETFPETYYHLKYNNWLDYKIFNRIAEQPNLNLMAMLTGSVKSNLNNAFVNDTDFVWNDFRRFNYVTAYAKDSIDTGVSQNLNLRFENKPTDYYFRRYLLASHMLPKKSMDSVYCTGPETTVERILNLAKNFLSTVKSRPTFSIFWMDSFNRADMDSLDGLDEKLKSFFQYLRSEEILKNSFVIFLSDQGCRGAEHKSPINWFGRQLPFLYIWVPPLFRRKFPEKYNHLRVNSNRLTTVYDLYLTIQDILTMYGENFHFKESADCPTCKSLFEKTAYARCCVEASINFNWCSCLGYKPLRSDDVLVKLAEGHLIATLQNAIDNQIDDSTVCEDIKPSVVNYAWLSETPSGDDKLSKYMKISIKTDRMLDLNATLGISYHKKRPIFRIFGNFMDLYEEHMVSYCRNKTSFFDNFFSMYYNAYTMI